MNENPILTNAQIVAMSAKDMARGTLVIENGRITQIYEGQPYNPKTETSNRLGAIRVAMTIVGGKTVWQSHPSTG